jgi:hypothetical protein
MRELPRMNVASRWHLGTLACAALVLGSCSLLFSESVPAADAGAEPLDAEPLGLDARGGGDGGTTIQELFSIGLLARYYIDEVDPVVLNDSTTNGNKLALNGVLLGGPDGRRGLQWSEASVFGSAGTTLEVNSIRNLAEQQAFTVELVVQALAVGSADSSVLFELLSEVGKPPNNQYALRALETDTLEFVFEGTVVQSWPASGIGSLSVLHLVFDSANPTASDRVRLYSNGGRLASVTQDELAQGVSPKFSDASTFTLGNALADPRSIAGRIGYLGVYNEALGETAIMRNAMILQANDDTPLSAP